MDSESEVSPTPSTRAPSLWWNLGISAFWFSTSLKWFTMFFALPDMVSKLYPGEEGTRLWGMIVAIGALEAMIGPVVFGYWSDRLASKWGRRRPFIAIGAGLTVLALMFLAGANSFGLLVLGYFFLQISDDIATAPYQAIIPDLVPKDHRGAASGTMALLQQLAQIGAAVLGLSFGASPFLLFGIIAAINIVCAIIVLATARETPLDPMDRPKASRISIKTWFEPFKIPDFRWVWFTRFLNSLGFYMILVYLLMYFEQVVKVFKVGPLTIEKPFQAMIVVALLISLIAALSAQTAGKMSDRIGRKKVIIWSGYVMFASLLPFAVIPNYAVILGLSVVFAVGYGAYLSADWALASDIMPNDENFGRDMGMWTITLPLGQQIAGWLGGVITFLNVRQHGLGFSSMFIFAAFAFLASTVLIKKIRGAT